VARQALVLDRERLDADDAEFTRQAGRELMGLLVAQVRDALMDP
jgi:hypothetical protein